MVSEGTSESESGCWAPGGDVELRREEELPWEEEKGLGGSRTHESSAPRRDRAGVRGTGGTPALQNRIQCQLCARA